MILTIRVSVAIHMVSVIAVAIVSEEIIGLTLGMLETVDMTMVIVIEPISGDATAIAILLESIIHAVKC